VNIPCQTLLPEEKFALEKGRKKSKATRSSCINNSDMGMNGLKKLFIGSTIKHINTSEYAMHLILILQIEEQNVISESIDSIEILVRNGF
jgi:hypothetical protein